MNQENFDKKIVNLKVANAMIDALGIKRVGEVATVSVDLTKEIPTISADSQISSLHISSIVCTEVTPDEYDPEKKYFHFLQQI